MNKNPIREHAESAVAAFENTCCTLVPLHSNTFLPLHLFIFSDLLSQLSVGSLCSPFMFSFFTLVKKCNWNGCCAMGAVQQCKFSLTPFFSALWDVQMLKQCCTQEWSVRTQLSALTTTIPTSQSSRFQYPLGGTQANYRLVAAFLTQICAKSYKDIIELHIVQL